MTGMRLVRRFQGILWEEKQAQHKFQKKTEEDMMMYDIKIHLLGLFLFQIQKLLRQSILMSRKLRGQMFQPVLYLVNWHNILSIIYIFSRTEQKKKIFSIHCPYWHFL